MWFSLILVPSGSKCLTTRSYFWRPFWEKYFVKTLAIFSPNLHHLSKTFFDLHLINKYFVKTLALFGPNFHNFGGSTSFSRSKIFREIILAFLLANISCKPWLDGPNFHFFSYHILLLAIVSKFNMFLTA